MPEGALPRVEAFGAKVEAGRIEKVSADGLR
jgi:hypothetical protein